MKKLVIVLFSVLILFTTACNNKKNYDDSGNSISDDTKGREFQWANIAMGDYIPKTPSTNGIINANTVDNLNLTVYNVTANQYDKYVEDCVEMGYNVDKELLSSSFKAYNDNGYELKLKYNESGSTLNILLIKSREYKELIWPSSGYGALIPNPISNVGSIEKNTDNGFVAYVGDTDKEAFEKYITTCQEKGYTIDEDKRTDSFSAKNSDGYKLKVTYEGNKVIKIEMDEPIFDVTFDIECDENIIFSKYDVKIYIDGLIEGTLKHGTKEKYKVSKKKGTYEVRFVNDEDSEVKGYINVDISKEETIKIKIHCYNSKIEATLVSGGKSSTPKETSTPVPKDDSTPEPSVTTTPTPAETTKPTSTPKPTAKPKVDKCAGSSYKDDAKSAFQNVGKKLYPYGIKFHWILDLKDFSYKGKCVWHIEVGVDVTNQYGAKRKGVAKGDVDFNKNVVKNFRVD